MQFSRRRLNKFAASLLCGTCRRLLDSPEACGLRAGWIIASPRDLPVLAAAIQRSFNSAYAGVVGLAEHSEV